MEETKKRRVIGLVGGICSGKSTVSRILKEKGCYCIDCDKLGHKKEPNSLGFKKIIDTFGSGVIDENGFVDRKKLGSIVFANADEMKKLCQITWPVIHDLALEEINACSNPIIVVEAAILLEAGWTDIVDEIWVVEVDRAIAIDRLKQRNHLSEEECIQRLNSQSSNEERAAFATHLLRNNGDLEELVKQIDEIL